MDRTVVVPIANSAGFAIDQIGMAIAFAAESQKLGQDIELKLCADERFRSMVLESAGHLNISVAYPYERTQIDPKLSILSGPRHMAENIKARNEILLDIEDVAQTLNYIDPKRYELVNSPAGDLPANPIAWVARDVIGSVVAEVALQRTAQLALQHAGTNEAAVRFVFFFGGKSLTDSESSADAKRIGGMVKSIGAEDQIKEIADLQKQAAHQNTLIVPVFSQYGDLAVQQARIREFNQRFDLITPVTDLSNAEQTVDWNSFALPSLLIASAHANYGAAVIGNGSTMQHLAAASVPHGLGMPITILRPAWVEIRGEDRWDAAAKFGRVNIVTADQPVNITFDEIIRRVEHEPAEAVKLIKQTSENVCKRAYAGLLEPLLSGAYKFPANNNERLNPP